MPLQVIGAGFGRTGTLSMKAALEQLGYGKCHHMLEVFASDDQIDIWHRISQGETPNWDQVFEGFGASVDFPSASYWRELAAQYPDVKIILTSRSFESWYESATETIYAVSKEMPAWTRMIPKPRKINEMIYGAIWERVFGGQFEDKDAAQRVFEQHEADVKAAFPPDRLLVFHPKEGWEPLCTFLGKPVPDTAFPNVNDRSDFQNRIGLFRRLQLVPYAVGGAIALAALIAYLAFR